MQKKIVRREGSIPSIDHTLQELPPILQRIYAARKVSSLKELDNELISLLPYSSLLGIDLAAHLLAENIIHNQSILIIGDFDADGATSTALAIRALRNFGAQKVGFLVPNRFAFGYGLTKELVEVAKKDHPDLLITVDNGIANHSGVDAAKALGMKVIITDHHLPTDTLPNADAIVNPNQVGDPFPSKNLAGVGVIFYVMLALRKKLIEINWFEKKSIAIPNMAQLLDLVALGTIADLVPLDHNNRILVHQGLMRIRSGRCVPGIVALLEIANREFTRVVAADLGFAVGARLNAAGRIDDMSLGIECLLTDDPIRVREMAQLLNQLNDERKHIEKGMQSQAMSILQKLTTELSGQLPRGLCLFDDTWHQGVIGILAARIKDHFNRPVIVFAPGQENEIKGSARSIAGLHIRDILALIDAKYPGLILKFGGHAMAAGLTMMRDRINEFSDIFSNMIAQRVTEAQLEYQLISDGELKVDELGLELAALLRNAGPWGQAFPEPLFDDTFRMIEQRIVGGKHLKLKLAKAEKLLDAIAFFVDVNDWPNHRCEFVKAAYRLDINEYKGRQSPQLIIEHLEPIK